MRKTLPAALAVAVVGSVGCSDQECRSLTEPLLVASVELAPAPAPAALTLRVGQTRQFSATPLTRCRNPVVGATVGWSASNPAVASVTPAGLVTAVAPGTGTITATSEGKSATAALTITVIPVAAIAVTPDPAQVGQGETLALSAVVTDSAGNVMLGHLITWSSGDTTVASVDPTGLVTGVAPGGPVAVTASTDTVSASAAVTVTQPPAANLVFTSGPSDVVAGAAFSPVIEVSVVDSFGAVVRGDTTVVRLAIGTNPGGSTLAGTTTVKAIDGVAAFGDVTLDRVGTGYALTASAGGLSTRTSGLFSVTPGAPARLVFIVQPTDAGAGVPISPPLQVAVVDRFDNVVTGDASDISVRLGSNPGGGTLSGPTSATAMNGVATFAGLSIDKAGGGYTLIAERAGSAVAPATSAPFSITPGSAVALRFGVEPTSALAGAPIAPPVEVRVVDAFENTVTSSTATVDIDIADNPGSGTLGGTRSIGAVQGVATFADLWLDKVGIGYTLEADASNLASIESQPFSIHPGAPVRVAFTVQPTTTGVNEVIAPPVEVSILDPFGNLVTGSTALVTVGIAFNPGGSTLGGKTTQPAVAGVAVFNDLVLDRTGNGYLLSANSVGLVGSLSTFFNVR